MFYEGVWVEGLSVWVKCMKIFFVFLEGESNSCVDSNSVSLIRVGFLEVNRYI